MDRRGKHTDCTESLGNTPNGVAKFQPASSVGAQQIASFLPLKDKASDKNKLQNTKATTPDQDR